MILSYRERAQGPLWGNVSGHREWTDPDSPCYHKRTKCMAVETNLPHLLRGGLELVWQTWVEYYSGGQGHRVVECVSPSSQGKKKRMRASLHKPFQQRGSKVKHPKVKWAHLCQHSHIKSWCVPQSVNKRIRGKSWSWVYQLLVFMLMICNITNLANKLTQGAVIAWHIFAARRE